MQQPLPDSNDVKTYNPAAAQIWQFPFTAGHLYEYELGSIATTSQNFNQNKNWDAGATGASAVMPLPANREIFTVVGGSANLGWKKISFDHTQVDDTGATRCEKDASGKCRLAQLFAACNAAGINSGALQTPSANPTQAATLGLLVQQIRGHCSAHSPAITGTPIMVPTDAQCDLRKQKNRAQLGGVDHSSPSVVGPS